MALPGLRRTVSGAGPERVFSTPVDPAFGFSRISVKLSIPALPNPARVAAFSEHLLDPATGEASDTVIAVGRNTVAVSEDLGANWEIIPLLPDEPAEFVHSFTAADGSHLLQIKAPPTAGRDDAFKEAGRIHRFDRDWRHLGSSRPGSSHWHGSCSIGEAGGTIMYAEYPNNKTKYRLDPEAPVDERASDLRAPAVYRSRDGGATWVEVFRRSWRDIRHFHTLTPDRYASGHWWLSSGDAAVESRVWRSTDDGDTWVDVSTESPQVELHPSVAGQTRLAFRYTDVWIDEARLIWGADDWLGGFRRTPDEKVPFHRRSGSRLFMAAKDDTLRPECLGYVGNPVRSLIDVGPCLLALTEAKHLVYTRPQVVLISKADPQLVSEIFSIDVLGAGGTGFTYSHASRKAKEGVFFTRRTRFDVCEAPARILRWEVALH